MGWWHGVVSRLRALALNRREEAELDEEMRFHIERETVKLLGQGLDAREARREAHRRFGGVDRMRERTRDERGTRWLEDTARDLGLAARRLARAPGFSAVTIGTLALGIGATTAMFSLVDGVLIRDLPYPDADRMVSVWERSETGEPRHASYLNFSDWRREASSFDALAAYTPPAPLTVLGPSGGVRATVTRVSEDFFEVARVPPALGRTPTPDEHRPDGAPVAVVSHRFWLEALGAPPALSGLALGVQGLTYDVVGVMPADFEFPSTPDLWLSLDRAVPWTVRANHVVRVVGRLAPGREVAVAAEELERVHAGIRATAPEVETPGVVVRALHDELVVGAREPLLLLMGAAGFLLLVACGNVATTFLARGAGRSAEMGVRASLGAGRGRLVRQLVAESVLTAALGALAALVVAAGILDLTRVFDPGAVPRLGEVALDLRVLLFTLGVAALTVLGFGLLPALRVTAGDLAGATRAGRSGTDRRHRRTWRILIAGEVALAVVLLAGAGLLLRSLGAIMDQDLGFDPAGVATARLHLPAERFGTAQAAHAFLDDVTMALDAGPGVEATGVGLMLPIRGSGSVGGPVTLDDGSRTDAWFHYRVADGGFFDVLRIPLLEGRLFGPDDGADATHVAVIDEAMARILWPGESAIGRTFEPGAIDPYPGRGLTVVGVVGGVRDWSQEPGSSPTYYVSSRQRPAFLGLFGLHVVARGADAAQVAGRMRDEVRRINADVPVEVAVLRARLGDSAGDRRFTALLLGGFAFLALALASVGIYGVVSYAAARRSREMGIRLALGARPAQVRGTVQAEALAMVGFGLGAGLVGSLALSRMLGGLLFDVGGFDPVAYAGAVAALLLTAWAASWAPARRATRVHPVETLRGE
jgi:predicted permease